MSRLFVGVVCAAIALLALGGGCERKAQSGSSNDTTHRDAAAKRSPTRGSGAETESAVLANDTLPPDADDVWRGLERHEIQLDQKLLVVKGSRGVIACPYLNIGAFEKFGEACALVPAVDTAGMLDSKVTAVSPKARELGIEVGMSGREALDKIR